MIAIVIAKKIARNKSIINELCISCRALGRNLEDFLILKSFDIIKNRFNVTKLIVEYKKMDRNLPAIKWLGEYAKVNLVDSGNIQITKLEIPKYDGLSFSIKICV